MSSDEEQTLGAILYAAQSPDYTLRSGIFPQRQVFQVPISTLRELANRASGVPTAVAGLVEAANPAVFSGLGGMVGMKMWKDLKKKVADRPVVQLKSGPLPAELLAAAKSKMAYDEVKDVKVKKVMMSSDLMLDIGAGFMHSEKIFFDGRAGDEVRSLIRATPLASRLKE